MGKQYPLKAVRTVNTYREREKKKKKTVPFRENLLGSVRPFPGQIQFFMLGAIRPLTRGAYHHRSDKCIYIYIVYIIYAFPISRSSIYVIPPCDPVGSICTIGPSRERVVCGMCHVLRNFRFPSTFHHNIICSYRYFPFSLLGDD